MARCYLTIDDSPSPFTKDMIDFLIERSISALLFCRGDMIEKFGNQALVYAVQQGFVLGNHAHSHTRFSEMSYDHCIREIEQTDRVIDQIYQQAGIERPGKYFRFPHMDRGTGGYVVDYDAYNPDYRDFVTKLFADGLNITLVKPTAEMVEKKRLLQDYLAEYGYIQPFQNITYPWFKDTEMADAKDCMYTFSTSDWMVLNRHIGRWKYQSIDDLKQKISDDVWLNNDPSHSIILAHDKQDPEMLAIFKSLIDSMVIKEYMFVPIQ